MKSISPIQLFDRADFPISGFTHYPVIAVQFEKVAMFDPVPTHVTVRDSIYYGHRFVLTFDDNGDQWFALSDSPDDEWLAANPL